jgi:hypothetical protein
MSKAVEEIGLEIDRLGPIAALQAIKYIVGFNEEQAIDNGAEATAEVFHKLRMDINNIQSRMIKLGFVSKRDWED